jgi:hypothetical protein
MRVVITVPMVILLNDFLGLIMSSVYSVCRSVGDHLLALFENIYDECVAIPVAMVTLFRIFVFKG